MHLNLLAVAMALAVGYAAPTGGKPELNSHGLPLGSRIGFEILLNTTSSGPLETPHPTTHILPPQGLPDRSHLAPHQATPTPAASTDDATFTVQPDRRGNIVKRPGLGSLNFLPARMISPWHVPKYWACQFRCRKAPCPMACAAEVRPHNGG